MNVCAVEGAGVIAILRSEPYHPGQDPRTDRLRARIGQELCMERGSPLPACALRPTGTGRSRSIATELDLMLREHVLQSTLVHCDQNEVRRLPADLEPEAATFKPYENRCAPAMSRCGTSPHPGRTDRRCQRRPSCTSALPQRTMRRPGSTAECPGQASP